MDLRDADGKHGKQCDTGDLNKMCPDCRREALRTAGR
jgi:hypothetical protein